jgi:hypothetical protein
VSACFGLIQLPAISCVAGDPVENVILVTMDGLRWQELFGGLDETMLGDEDNGTKESAELNRRFAAETAEGRRVRLMPFFWNVVAKHGVVFGDQEAESHIYVTNGMNFSYPGYSEILCGFPDPRIDSNAKTDNPNVTVLEWLHSREEYRGKVAVFGSWDVFPWIINTTRSGIPVNAGWRHFANSSPTPWKSGAWTSWLERFLATGPVSAMTSSHSPEPITTCVQKNQTCCMCHWEKPMTGLTRLATICISIPPRGMTITFGGCGRPRSRYLNIETAPRSSSRPTMDEAMTASAGEVMATTSQAATESGLPC